MPTPTTVTLGANPRCARKHALVVVARRSRVPGVHVERFARPTLDNAALLRVLRCVAEMQPPVIIWIIFTVQPDFVANNLYAAHGVRE